MLALDATLDEDHLDIFTVAHGVFNGSIHVSVQAVWRLIIMRSFMREATIFVVLVGDV